MAMENQKTGTTTLAIASILGIVGVLLMDPIAQNPEYHLFGDQRTILGITNFSNVVSNLPFLLVGIMGLYGIFGLNKFKLIADLRAAYILFFVGISLVAFGSGYYHLSPSNGSLVWDRIPMTIAFMALFSVILGEFISVHLGRWALWPLIVIGVFSVIYWHSTEAKGAGDLRLYILVQFLPMILIPLILWFFKSMFTSANGYWLLLFAYALAKVFEHFDDAIYKMPLLQSGHSFKHIVAAVGVFFLLKSYSNREPISKAAPD